MIGRAANGKFAAFSKSGPEGPPRLGCRDPARRRGDRARSPLELFGAAGRVRRRDDPRCSGASRTRRRSPSSTPSSTSGSGSRPPRSRRRRTRSSSRTARGGSSGSTPPSRTLTGWQREEVIGETPRILKSGREAPLLLQEALGDDPRGQRLAGRDPEPPQGRRDLLGGADHHAGPIGGRGDPPLRLDQAGHHGPPEERGADPASRPARPAHGPLQPPRVRGVARADGVPRPPRRAVVASPPRPRQLQDRQRRARPSRRRPGPRRARPPRRDARPPGRRGRPVRRATSSPCCSRASPSTRRG